MDKEERISFLSRWLFVFSLAPGLVACAAYHALRWYTDGAFSFSLIKMKSTLASITAGFSITAIGFLFAILAVAVALHDSYVIKKYKGDGYFKVYLRMGFLCVIYLAIVFILSILMLSNSAYSGKILSMVMIFTINGLCLIVLLIYVLLRLLNNSR